MGGALGWHLGCVALLITTHMVHLLANLACIVPAPLKLQFGKKYITATAWKLEIHEPNLQRMLRAVGNPTLLPFPGFYNYY